MATALVLRNAVVQIQTALASAKTITGISKASDATYAAYDSHVVRGLDIYKVKKIERDETARIATLQLEKQ